MIPRKLIPTLGSRLQMISQHVEIWHNQYIEHSSDGLQVIESTSSCQTSWRIWVAINNPNLPHAKWLGTYIELRPDGSMWTCTQRADGYEEYECMDKLTEKHL